MATSPVRMGMPARGSDVQHSAHDDVERHAANRRYQHHIRVHLWQTISL